MDKDFRRIFCGTKWVSLKDFHRMGGHQVALLKSLTKRQLYKVFPSLRGRRGERERRFKTDEGKITTTKNSNSIKNKRRIRSRDRLKKVNRKNGEEERE